MFFVFAKFILLKCNVLVNVSLLQESYDQGNIALEGCSSRA